MRKPYKPKLEIIKVIKDWQGEDWDVYEQELVSNGLIIYRGRPYAKTRGSYACILTVELADFLRQHSRQEVVKHLKFSGAKVSRFRRELNIQREQNVLDHKWALEHKNELLDDDFQDLQQKYGLTKNQVSSYTGHLRYKKVKTLNSRRTKNKGWLLVNKDVITSDTNTIQQIADQLGVTKHRIKNARNQLKRLMILDDIDMNI